LGLIGAQLCLPLGNVLLPRANRGQIEALFRHLQPRLRHVQGGLGAIEVLLADGPAGGELCQRRHPLPLLLGIDQVRFGRRDIGLGLRDFLRAAAVMQFLHHRLLRLHLGFRLRRLRFEPARVQPGQNLSARDLVPFLDQHLGDALAVVEGELDLAQIDIPIKDQSVLVRFRPSPPNLTSWNCRVWLTSTDECQRKCQQDLTLACPA
jgi:hypothetical protein